MGNGHLEGAVNDDDVRRKMRSERCRRAPDSPPRWIDYELPDLRATTLTAGRSETEKGHMMILRTTDHRIAPMERGDGIDEG